MVTTFFPPSRSHSTNTSPQRPVSSCGTIRVVKPSPESSFSVALQQNAFAHSSPRRRNSSATLMRPSAPTPSASRQNSTIADDHTSNDMGINLHNDFAQDDSSPTQQHVMRRQKDTGNGSTRASLRKNRRTPRPLSMPMPLAATPQSADAKIREYACPETPSPVTAEQRRLQYTPMGFDHGTAGVQQGVQNRNVDNPDRIEDKMEVVPQPECDGHEFINREEYETFKPLLVGQPGALQGNSRGGSSTADEPDLRRYSVGKVGAEGGQTPPYDQGVAGESKKGKRDGCGIGCVVM